MNCWSRLQSVSLCGLALSLLPFLTYANGETAGHRAACGDLAKLSLPHTTILSAETVAPGMFVPQQAADAANYKGLPAFCRVVAKSAPTADSDIKIEVWLPASGWNGKFRGQGNGGFAGQINYDLLGLSVSQGYASAGTDTGHTAEGTDASWALGHPEKIVDFGNRAIHEMTSTAKSVVDAYYGKAPDHSYFASCSDGGREALMEAQRFPYDYDGILAGAPAYYWTNMVAGGMQKVQRITHSPNTYIPPAKIPAIAAAVNAACDAADGVKDGIVNDPRHCNFKPESLLCKSTESDTCLTQPQVDSLKTIYAPVLNASGKQIYPGTLPGGEDGPGGWALWLLGTAPDKTLSYAFTTGYFKDMVYGNPAWDYSTFNLDTGLKLAISKTAGPLNATDAHLQAFARHGGKLILYHGWNDPAISPLSTIDYYQRVQQMNGNAASFVRLFMVPGMQHCAGGPGPSSFGQFGWRPGTGPDDPQHDLYLGLEQWVEKGQAPEEVIAAKFDTNGHAPRLSMTRPLCAYPLVAKYKGSGATTGAGNFICAAE
jgi:feruloyl esterase